MRNYLVLLFTLFSFSFFSYSSENSHVELKKQPIEYFFSYLKQDKKKEWKRLFHKNYCSYSFFSLFLTQEISEKIAQLWMALENQSSYCSPTEHFVQRLVNCTISCSDKSREWNIIDDDLRMTHDGKYYVGMKYGPGMCIRIYDVATEKLVKYFSNQSYCILLKKKNLLIVQSERSKRNFKQELCLYDIDKNQVYELTAHEVDLDWIDYVVISPDENYIVIGYGNNVHLYHIAHLPEVGKDAIGHDKVKCVAFSSDSTRCVSASEDEVVLWKINKDKNRLEQITSCAIDMPYIGRVKFMGEYVVATCFMEATQFDEIDAQVLFWKINEGDAVSMSKCLSLDNVRAYWHFPAYDNKKNHTFPTDFFMYACQDVITVMYSSGKIIKHYKMDGQYIEDIMLSNDKKHLFVSVLHDFESGWDSHILHLSCNDGADTVVKKKNIQLKIRDIQYADNSLILGNLHQVVLNYRRGYIDTCVIFDLNGTVIKSLPSKMRSNAYFHPNGREVIQDGTLHTLYPAGTKEHFKKQVKQGITIPKYAALRALCNATDQEMLKFN